MNTRDETIRRCETAAIRMRQNVLRLALRSGPNGAHLGGCFSIIELLATLYCGIMQVKPGNPQWKSRDRLILSKGQGSLAQYTAMEASGIISEAELFTYGQNGGPLPCASSFNPELGIEYSNGTLGFGLSYAVGLALASKKTANPYHVYVLLGDGECNEGSVWEPAMSAPHFGLSNLTAIVDFNSMQSDGSTHDVLNVRLEDMWRGFGWEVLPVDGHDITQLLDLFSRAPVEGKPRVILARTIKGKGVSFMENNNDWHHKWLTEELFDAAMSEISGNTQQHGTD